MKNTSIINEIIFKDYIINAMTEIKMQIRFVKDSRNFLN